VVADETLHGILQVHNVVESRPEKTMTGAYENPPDQVEVFFNLRDTNVARFALSQVPVLPRTGETIYLGTKPEDGGGSYDVIGLRHEYNDSRKAGSLALVRVTVILKERVAKK
jgi:hypothetical protein